MQIAPTSSYHCVYIIVHGTWCHHSGNWFMPSGDFYETLKTTLPHSIPIVPFLWSGKNTHTARLGAGKALAELIKSYPLNTEIHLVCHSHGASVGFIASQELAQSGITYSLITEFFSLATPIQMAQYTPNMQVIGKLYHLFSLQDSVQPVFGMFERILPNHYCCASIRVLINNQEPEHNELHSPLIALWIAQQNNKEQLLRQNTYNHAPLLLLTANSVTYQYDTERAVLLAQDKMLKKRMQHAYKMTAYKAKDWHKKGKSKLLSKINKYLP